jgi:prevent-host-death family protein
MERIGVRELRQHASRYLARVARGERIEVTDRGRLVAMLVPAEDDPWHALLASGRITPPSTSGRVTDDAPVDYGVSASARLEAMREDAR